MGGDLSQIVWFPFKSARVPMAALLSLLLHRFLKERLYYMKKHRESSHSQPPCPPVPSPSPLATSNCYAQGIQMIIWKWILLVSRWLRWMTWLEVDKVVGAPDTIVRGEKMKDKWSKVVYVYIFVFLKKSPAALITAQVRRFICNIKI